MATSLPLQIAETVQTAHINRHPSPAHDLNPSTAASRKEPVTLVVDHDEKHDHHFFLDEGIDGADDEDEEEDDEYDDGVGFRGLKPKPRRAHLPPLPDLRYEQSYLHSIRNADTWWKVVLVTARDQMVMPFMQGVLYNLAICGWQFYNKNARVTGSSLGARVRRWWYGVNNWPIPGEKKTYFKARR